MTNSFKQIFSWFFLFVISWSIVFLSLASTSAFADQKIDKSLDFIEEGNIRISNLNGKIEVFGWNKKQVKVEGKLSDTNKSFTFERNNNSIEIEMREKPWHGNSSGDHLKIYVPIKSNISFESPNSEFYVKQQQGSVDVETMNGNVYIDDIQGRVRAELLNGNIYCKDVRGRLSLETVNGNIEVQGATSDNGVFSAVNGDIDVTGDVNNLKLEAVSGSINLKLQKIDSLQMETVSGEITAEVELAESGDIRASSVSGTVKLIFLKEPSAHFEILNHTGGKVTNNLSEDAATKNDFGPGKTLKFTHKGGRASVSLSTLHGEVVLDRK